jgi:integrase/recombinase XerD
VDLPSGQRYWTVIDDDLRVVPFADQGLPFLRFGRGRAELTTKSHASGAALYFRWCLTTGRNWTEAAQDLGLFMVWLYTPSQLVNGSTGVAFGPGTKPVRGRAAYQRDPHGAAGSAVVCGLCVCGAPRSVLGQIYELADTRDLPLEPQGETSGLPPGVPACCPEWPGAHSATAWSWLRHPSTGP